MTDSDTRRLAALASTILYERYTRMWVRGLQVPPAIASALQAAGRELGLDLGREAPALGDANAARHEAHVASVIDAARRILAYMRDGHPVAGGADLAFVTGASRNASRAARVRLRAAGLLRLVGGRAYVLTERGYLATEAEVAAAVRTPLNGRQ